MSTSSSHNTLPPFGKYASWAAPTSIVIGVLAIVGALAGGRGDVAGTVVAMILNPLAWLAIWFWFKSTRISCPHCGSGLPVTPQLETQKVGSILHCFQCRNEFRKPAMSGQTVSIAEPVNVQPAFSRPVQPIINDGAWSLNAEVLRPSVHVVEPKAPPASAFERARGNSESMLPVVATPVQEQHNLIVVEAPESEIDPEPDPVVMRVDGTNSFVTLKEHKRRGWKHAARCDLSRMNFRGVSFAGANLEGAKLDGSDFTGCDFRNAVLKNASAKDCIFEGVDFAGANVLKADFQDSNLTKVKFCPLSGDFAAVIDQVNFGHCNLSDAMFVPVPPKAAANVGRCKVNQSDFSGSDMSRCNLQGMDFRTCIFRDANLFGTSLQNCNFEGVDLSSANLINAHLSQIEYSGSSKFPVGFVLPGNATNADVVRKAQQEETRKANQVFWLTLMIVAFAICSVIVVAKLSKSPRARIESSENEATPMPESPLPDAIVQFRVPTVSMESNSLKSELVSLSGKWESNTGLLIQMVDSGNSISLQISWSSESRSPMESGTGGVLQRSGKFLNGTLSGKYFNGPYGEKTLFQGEVINENRINYTMRYIGGNRIQAIRDLDTRAAPMRSMSRVVNHP